MSGRMQALGDLFGSKAKHALDSARGKRQDQFQRQETIKSKWTLVVLREREREREREGGERETERERERERVQTVT